MTHRLYYTDSYLTEFTAQVVDTADDGRRVYLDQTALYPTSGGQPHDLGSLGGVAVVGVVDEEDRIAHLVAAPLGQGEVQGVVDWRRRFDHMQQHTGQHLLSAVLADLFNAPTVSVHFGPEMSTLDLGIESISPDQVRKAEERANQVITENRPVTVSFEDAATAIGLRKATDRSGTLRIVSIADLDRSACGGTHVRATGEIGALLIRRSERVKKQVRLEFLCGLRATRRARTDFDLLSEVAAGASASVEEVPGVVAGLRAQLKAAQGARKQLADEANGYRAARLLESTAPGADGVRRIFAKPDSATTEDLRGLAQAATANAKVFFAGVVTDPPTLVLAASADAGVDAGALLREILGQLGGKGGGNARMAQGGIPSPESLPALLRQAGFEA
ncbi:MAG TPA: alanyl-tRNA editing protein [Gemmatimonadales bacterium]|nr:alanyl-tRNA editing protein [Gemmatimonadales bacterium]